MGGRGRSKSETSRNIYNFTFRHYPIEDVTYSRLNTSIAISSSSSSSNEPNASRYFYTKKAVGNSQLLSILPVFCLSPVSCIEVDVPRRHPYPQTSSLQKPLIFYTAPDQIFRNLRSQKICRLTNYIDSWGFRLCSGEIPAWVACSINV